MINYDHELIKIYDKIDSIRFDLNECMHKEYLKKLCIEIHNIYTLEDIHP